MTQLQAIRQFVDLVLGEPVIIAREREDWSMAVDESRPRLILPSNLNHNDREDKLFRADFIERCPCARGFANITITLLHEVGHWMTRFDVDWEQYYNEREGVYGIDYFHLDAEMKATDWAIAWLSNPYNRKYAKAFERAYFA